MIITTIITISVDRYIPLKKVSHITKQQLSPRIVQKKFVKAFKHVNKISAYVNTLSSSLHDIQYRFCIKRISSSFYARLSLLNLPPEEAKKLILGEPILDLNNYFSSLLKRQTSTSILLHWLHVKLDPKQGPSFLRKKYSPSTTMKKTLLNTILFQCLAGYLARYTIPPYTPQFLFQLYLLALYMKLSPL